MAEGITCRELAECCKGSVSFYGGSPEIILDHVTHDSRKARKGSLFVAVRGFEADGHDYIHQAFEQGASAVLLSQERAGEFSGAVKDKGAVFTADDVRRALSSVSHIVYGKPSMEMTVIGITGTNGKTSITYMLEEAFRFAGRRPGVIGTINYRWGGREMSAPNTTPEAPDLHEMMREMRNDGIDVLLMEVSSHALTLGRVDDVAFDVAVFTNLTGDHLDFHNNMEEYYGAKARFFDILNFGPKKKRYAVINVDDEYGLRLYSEKKDQNASYKTYGFSHGACYSPDPLSVQNRITGLSYCMASPASGTEVTLATPGTFHIYNSLASLAVLDCLGIDVPKGAEGLGKISRVPGRFDVVSAGSDFYAVVDYAHTSDALLKLLTSVNEVKENRIITLIGCGGDRDRTKRPVMGSIAAEKSDIAIITSDNPRTEDPEAIISEITAGIDGDNYIVIPDREEAIGHAVSIAQKGDIIIIAGKGHEDYQIIGKEKIHFDDRETALRFIEERRAE